MIRLANLQYNFVMSLIKNAMELIGGHTVQSYSPVGVAEAFLVDW